MRRLTGRWGGALVSVALCAVPLDARAAVASAPPAADTRDQALACMSAAIAYEAGLEPIEGREAVGQVIMNRLRDPIFPKTVCGVVYQGSLRRTGCQFTFTCDGSLQRRLSERTLAGARAVAESVLDGASPDHVGGATFYHAFYVLPRWAPRLTRVAQIGAHIFYRAGTGGALVAALSAANAARRPIRGGPNPSFSPWGLPMAAMTERPASTAL